MTNTIQSDIALLTPRFQKKIKALMELGKRLGMDIYPFETLRSLERQQRLYGQNRTAAECKKAGVPESYAQPNKPRATDKTNSGKHLIGEAADMVLDTNPDPIRRTPSRTANYQLLSLYAPMLGLRSLYPQDKCHFQDTDSQIVEVIKSNSEMRKHSEGVKQAMLHLANEVLRAC